MRLVISIVSFCLAVVFIGAGVAQRTIFLQPGSIVQPVSVPTENVYTVIGPDVLSQNPGAPAVAASREGTLTVAFGRTDDMLSWIGAAPYTRVSLDNGAIVSNTVTQAASVGALEQLITGSPSGSDLWLSELTADGSVSLTTAIPAGYSAIVASDGIAPAPSDLIVSWPIDNSTPWVGPFFVLGVVLFVLGGVLLWLHWREHHRAGPRRRGPEKIDSTPPRAVRRSPAPKRRELGPARGRRSRFVVVALMLAPVALTGCSADYWPAGPAVGEASPSATAESANGAESLAPAVTITQMERILGEISGFTAAADSTLTAAQLPVRFAGPALAARQANYAIRSKKSDFPAPAAIPAQPLSITLPQQVENSWPRLVITVSQNALDTALAPVALVLLQDSPRDNYHVYYAITLVPNAQSPQLAPASFGAPRVPADSKLLRVQPNLLAGAYADLLNLDTASRWAGDFLAEGDTLREQLGNVGQDAIRAQLPENSAISFSAGPGSGPALALATNDAGAIVAVQVDQLRRITPTGGGVVGFGEGSASAALSGFTGKSPVGVQSTSGLQLLLYVPAIDSADPIRLLGWTESLSTASEATG